MMNLLVFLIGSQSDIGYSSMVEGQPLKGKSSSQRDLLNDVKGKLNLTHFN